MPKGGSPVVRLEIKGRWPGNFGRREVEAVVVETLRVTGRKGLVEFGLCAVGDDRMRELNSAYRGSDKVTDVLSFRLAEDESFAGVSGADGSLGDVIVCLPQVRRQARETGRDVRTETALMVAHGTLHLLGYDHCEKKDEDIMFGLQQDALMNLNYL